MTQGVRNYLPLFKLRICSLITFSAIVGLISASTELSLNKLMFLTLVTMLASMGASVFNHYFDMDIDGFMERTRLRPIPSGAIKNWKAVLFIAIVLFAASIVISLTVLNYMVGLHLFLGAFVYVVVYTVWLKRRSWLNIIFGGLAGSFAVLAGGASVNPEFCVPPILLSITMFFWTPSHFWSFAILHRDEYEKAGIPMLPNVVGDKKTARYILINTIVLVISSLVPSILGYLGIFYTMAAIAAGAFFIFRNVELLRDNSKEIARKNFRASMVYLAGLFLAVIIDVAIR